MSWMEEQDNRDDGTESFAPMTSRNEHKPGEEG